LTNLLLDKLTATSPSRVVNTVGVGYDRTNIDFDDFNIEKSDGRRGEAYNRSKLAVALFTTELAKRLEGLLYFVVVLQFYENSHSNMMYFLYIVLFPNICYWHSLLLKANIIFCLVVGT